jgi:hypothetical protein
MRETIKFVLNEKMQQKVKELIEQGYRYRCLGCNRIYKQPRQETYENGHGGRTIDMCVCGCDLFQKLEDMSCVEALVEPVDGKIVLKEHHLKYCRCGCGEIWCGNAEFECGAPLEFVEEKGDRKFYRCRKSGMTIIVLKSTEEEMTRPDETGSLYH